MIKNLGIPILGVKYDIVIEHIEDQNGQVHGTMDPDARKLTISPSTNDMLATLVHEVLHAILQEAGLRNILESSLEEAIMVALENGLMRSGMIRELKL